MRPRVPEIDGSAAGPATFNPYQPPTRSQNIPYTESHGASAPAPRRCLGQRLQRPLQARGAGALQETRRRRRAVPDRLGAADASGRCRPTGGAAGGLVAQGREGVAGGVAAAPSLCRASTRARVLGDPGRPSRGPWGRRGARPTTGTWLRGPCRNPPPHASAGRGGRQGVPAAVPSSSPATTFRGPRGRR
jgi:hypothetical protein